jgi:SAM-dependent methyltransferase
MRSVTGRLVKLRGDTTEVARYRGWLAAAQFVAHKIAQVGIRVAAYLGEFVVDTRYGMSTRGINRNEMTLRQIARQADANHYQAISLRGFRQVVSAAAMDPGTTAFVDLGAGRGRALVLAANLGFVQVLGIELDLDLARQADRNLARWRARTSGRVAEPRQFEVIVGDAAEVELPSRPILVFLYNSFGPVTLKVTLDRIFDSYASNCRDVKLCYFNPVHADIVESHPAFRLNARSSAWAVYSVACQA